MKTILPWILAVAFAVGAGTLYFSKSAADAELAKAREQVQQADGLKAQLDDAQKQVASQTDEIASMHKDTEELLRLRNQVRQLTDEKQQLTKQLDATQSQVERSQAEVQQVQARAAENAKSMAEQQILQMKQNSAVVSTCINNLRLLQAAKQQWALEQHKTPDAVPTPQDLTPYFPNNMLPDCPGGGHYTLNAVNAAPTCSIPGHVLQ
jgi:septal ring factor EnvC (AmiA/AmiB activator)